MRRIKIGMILMFALMISMPLVLQLLGINLSASSTENRKLKKRPELSFAQTKAGQGAPRKVLGAYRDVIAFKDAYDTYYKDNFVLKSWLFKSYYFIQNDFFGVDPIPQKVVKGTNGWLFLGDSYSNVLKESKAIIAFEEEELNKIKTILLKKKAWLAQQNIDFYLAVAPNKHSIYGEELPIKKGTKPTKREQLKKLFEAEDFNFIDLSDAFPEKRERRLYHKTNTHWNDYGAFWGYKALLLKIKEKYPSLEMPTLERFDIVTEISQQEDLTGMLGVNIEEERIIFNNPNEIAQKMTSTLPVPPNVKNYVFQYRSTINEIKILAFRDSFFTNLMKFVKESFGESVYISSWFNEEIVEIEKPNIVVWEIVERDLDILLLQ
jgi:hypothetical protein